MRFGIFYEHQLPRPWEPDSEHRLLKDALEQIELADRLGFDYVWEVEHHFLEEYSHSSAPEVFLAAASQRTSRIRIGHGIVQLPFGFNHPARVAERIATLDLVSDGRVDFGTGESSSEMELGGFGVRRANKRAEWIEALDVVTRLMVEEPFAGHSGPGLSMPPRNLVPKPLQKPHPPLWVACSRRETIHLAATKGIGALSFSFIEADEARHWVDDYYSTIASEACVPGGFAVNANLACVLPFMCHPDEGLQSPGASTAATSSGTRWRTTTRSACTAWVAATRPTCGRSSSGTARRSGSTVTWRHGGASSWAPSCWRRVSGRCGAPSAPPTRSGRSSAATRRSGSTSSSS